MDTDGTGRDEHRCRIAITSHRRISCFWKYLCSSLLSIRVHLRFVFAFPPQVGRLLNRMRTPTVRFITFVSSFALICAALPIAVHRRVVALTAEKPFAQYSHSVWRTENGLPQNTVRAIVQTRD